MDETLTLIEACRKGERKGQEMLFRKYYAFAMRIALRYSKDEQEAADIISLSFTKLFKSIHSYDVQKGSFEGWMNRIVINEALDVIKARNKYQEIDLSDYKEEAPVYNVLGEMDATHIMEYIRQLPAATHTVFMLYAVDGYKHREIASALSISEGTSKWHLSEARKILKQKLTGNL